MFKVKKRKFIAMFMVVLLFFIGKQVDAAGFVEWDSKINVQLNKEWTVTFSEIVDPATVNKNNVFINYNESNVHEKHPVKLEVDENKIVVIPLIDYSFDTEYILNIKDIVSTKGKSLNESIKMGFITESDPNEVITFEDSQIEFAIRVKVGKEHEDILKSDVLKITDLVLQSKNISDLTGLEHLDNLKSLYLHYNNISDLDPLRNLTNLETLGLYDNKISNLEPLRNSTNLVNLYLGKNKIVDLNPLIYLDKISYLDVNNNLVKDVLPIMKVSTLRTFVVFGNNLDSFEQQTALLKLRDKGIAVSY